MLGAFMPEGPEELGGLKPICGSAVLSGGWGVEAWL